MIKNLQIYNIRNTQIIIYIDRFLILNENKICHFGASLKDLDKSGFAFSELQMDANDILEKL